MSKNSKLELLRSEMGYFTIEAMLEEAIIDSVVLGICMNAGCDYTTEVEPDCDSGYCENCETQSVRSCLSIAGII